MDGCPVGGGMLCRCRWKLSWDGDLLDKVSLEGKRLEDRGGGGGGLGDDGGGAAMALGLGAAEMMLLLPVMWKLERCRGGGHGAAVADVLGVALLLLPVL
mmetsp:Transcript_12982/g.20427  ORF Transcript_12982/g.20427 Transcript_12982/m.20427 type:complete len:100 (-) Transcript_12982:258-557(-)